MTRRRLPLVLPALIVAAGLAGPGRAADDNPLVAQVKAKVKDPARPFAMTVTFKVKAGKEKEFEAAFVPCLAATHKEPGCVAYELNRDPDDPATYVMYEKFKSVAALEDHLKQTHTQTLLKTVGPLTDGDPRIKVYTAPQ
jgi:quinol monooxygenase YgiN